MTNLTYFLMSNSILLVQNVPLRVHTISIIRFPISFNVAFPLVTYDLYFSRNVTLSSRNLIERGIKGCHAFCF